MLHLLFFADQAADALIIKSWPPNVYHLTPDHTLSSVTLKCNIYLHVKINPLKTDRYR